MRAFLEAAAGTLRAGNEAPPNGTGRDATALLALALCLGIGLRAWLALVTDFPIGDGALFYEFVRATGDTFPRLPQTVRYNQIDVPFAYPPLSFWVGGLLQNLGIHPLSTVHYLPIAINALYGLLFALLLLRGGHSRLFVAIVLLFFASSFRSFEWLVMGGGLSRGMGSLFTLLALIACTSRSTFAAGDAKPLPIWRSAMAGACVAGAILSHLEWGVLAAASVVLSRALGSAHIREFVITSFAAGVVALLLIAPWLALVLGTHGPGPFLAAGGTSGWSIRSSFVHLLILGLSTLANPFPLLGGIVLILRLKLFWPAFILLCALLTPRHGATPITLATSVLSAAGAIGAYQLLLRLTGRRGVARLIVGAGILLVCSYSAYRGFRDARHFWPLGPQQRQSMRWVHENLPGASFAIVTGAPWHNDISAEWFPTLAGAASVTTVQGREWLPHRAHGRWHDMSQTMVASRSCEELLTSLAPFGQSNFIWAEWMQGCFAAPRFQLIHRNGPVGIFRVARP